MANSLRTNPIYIDDLTSAVDLGTYYPGEIILDSIEWCKPTGTSHYAQVLSGGANGVIVFDEYCTVANESLIKYFHGAPMPALYFPSATDPGTAPVRQGSGAFIVVLKR